jgi:DNA integrity scanning protein DisA with diadenylate cyclase activity
MEQSPAIASGSTAIQIPHILWTLKVYYHVNRILPLVPVLSEVKSILPSILIVSSIYVWLFNPLPLLFKALLQGQKDRVFSAGIIFSYYNKSALEHLGRHGTFKSRALWSVRDGKGLKCSFSFRFPYQNPVCISLLPHTCHMPCPSDHP